MSGEHISLSDQFGFQEGNYELTAGFPSKTFTRKSAEIMASAAQLLAQTPEGLSGDALQYGCSQGSAIYLRELAKFLTDQYGDKDPIKIEHLQVTGGATQGLHFTATELLTQDCVAFVEDPTYFIGIKVLKEDLCMKVVPVKTDDKGLDVSHLERLIDEHVKKETPVTSSRPFRGIVYTIPTFNNPTSVSFSPERCQQLVEVARRHDLLVFCDDVYNLLHYKTDGVPPKRLLAYEIEKYGKERGNVISNGSFSKIMGPALRLGWIEASKSIIDRLEGSNIAWSGGSFNHYVSQLMAIAIRDGFQQQMIQDMISVHTDRIKAVDAVLDGELSGIVKYNSPEGGYFYWLELPDSISLDDVAAVAEKDSVSFISGDRCSPSGGFKNCIRISFSFYEKKKLVRGVELLCKAIKQVANK